MKHFIFALALLVPCLVSGKKVSPLSGDLEGPCQIRWCTFNIRFQNSGDEKEGFGWSVRRDRVADYIRKNHIDIVGMQEVLHSQLQDLLERLPEYDYVGVGRNDGKTKGEYSPVFFLKEKYEVLDKGNFWLSETPDVAGSKGWDAAIERVASYAKLKDKATGEVFMAVNTHLDHVGAVARRESAKLIMRKIQEIVGTQPAVVTGDFNVTEDDEVYTIMTTSQIVNGKSSNCKFLDAYHMTPNHTGTTYTWHAFCHIPPLKREKIDFIFITPTIRVNHSHIEVPNPDALLSDHNPHWADLEF